MRVRLNRKRLIDFLSQSNLTQNHWAIKLGLSRGHLSDLVNGKHAYPSPKTREKLIEGLGLPFEDLFAVETESDEWSHASSASFQAALADRYLIDHELGHGGMGTVYLARDVKHGRQVAIKVISPEAVSGVGVEQFLKEIRRTAQLEHPHILTLLDSGEAAGYPYYVMPYVRGGSLRGRLETQHRLSLDDSLRIARGVAAALRYAHGERVVHCDIKPENILLGDDGHAYLADFGVARAVHAEVRAWRRRGEIDSSAGTPAYVSPEQASGEPEVDGRTDLYSLGCLMYEMLAGTPPFRGHTAMETVAQRFVSPPPDLRRVAPYVPSRIAALVRKSMALDSASRHPDAARFLAALDRASAGRRGPLAEAVTLRAARGRARLETMLRGVTTMLGGSKLVSNLLQDLRYAFRSLRRRPGHTAVLVATLALGIGVNSAMFSVVSAVLLRPLPYPDAGELVAIWESDWARTGSSAVTYPNYVDMRDQTDRFAALAAYAGGTQTVTGGDQPVRAPAFMVSPEFFDVWGVAPAMGGTFLADPGAANAVISYGFWQTNFGGTPDILGRTLSISGASTTIVGVMPRGFAYPKGAAVWVPRDLEGNFGPSRTAHNLRVVGRMEAGVAIEAAQTEMTGLAGRLATAYPDEIDPDFDIDVRSLRTQLTADSRSTLVLLLVVVGVVLLIACGNMASILLSQAIGRSREMAIRRAVGADGSRLTRQVLTESGVIGVIGAFSGLALSFGSMSALNQLVPQDFFHSGGVQLDWRVVAFTLGLGLITGVLFGSVPAWHAVKHQPAGTLRGDGADVLVGGRRRNLGGLFVVPQYAFSLTALIAAGLVLMSLFRLSRVDPGFETSGLVTMELSLPFSEPSPYADEPYVAQFHRDLRARVEALPGVRSVTYDLAPPLSDASRVNGGAQLEGAAESEWPFYPDWRVVGPDYFTTVGIPLVRGRDFTESDDEDAVPVAIVNEALATRMWGTESPLGKRLRLSSLDWSREQSRRWLTVVGVAANVADRGLDSPPRVAVYVPAVQHLSRARGVDLVISVAQDPSTYTAPLRDILRTVDAGIPVGRIETMATWMRESTAEPRFRAGLLTAFGGLALLLALLGMYGVMAYSVTQRRREMALRVALGADRQRIVRLLTNEGFRYVVVGQVVGTIGALAISRLVDDLLFGVSPTDWRVFLPVSVALAGIVVLTGYLPARRAGRVEPIEALKEG